MHRLSEVVGRGLALALLHLEESAVDDASQQTATDGAQPVHPLVLPHAHNDGRAKGTRRVHAGASEFDLKI